MEAPSKPKVVFLSDDKYVVESTIQAIYGWGLEAKGFTNSQPAIQYIARNKCDIVIVDVIVANVCCPPLIIPAAGEAKIIVMTDRADKSAAIKSLQLGAFDLLEKPLRNELLRHSVLRALALLEKERESSRLADELKSSRSKLLAQQQRLESLNAQLFDTNKALAVFAQNMQREREELEKRAALKLRSIILPVVAKLKNSEALHAFESQFDMLTLQVEDMTTGFALDFNVAMVLSAAEMRVASLIKNGATTVKIAAYLHISENTVRTHRKNIRRKLKIGTQYSLRNFLNSRIGQARQFSLNKN
ncbi:MAG: LuxR C-terminal-related transcriptional regulator [Syntrophobacteraceae bacterium]